jgi:hypothetical protein
LIGDQHRVQEQVLSQLGLPRSPCRRSAESCEGRGPSGTPGPSPSRHRADPGSRESQCCLTIETSGQLWPVSLEVSSRRYHRCRTPSSVATPAPPRPLLALLPGIPACAPSSPGMTKVAPRPVPSAARRGSLSAAGPGKNAFHRRWPMTWGGRRQMGVKRKRRCWPSRRATARAATLISQRARLRSPGQGRHADGHVRGSAAATVAADRDLQFQSRRATARAATLISQRARLRTTTLMSWPTPPVRWHHRIGPAAPSGCTTICGLTASSQKSITAAAWSRLPEARGHRRTYPDVIRAKLPKKGTLSLAGYARSVARLIANPLCAATVWIGKAVPIRLRPAGGHRGSA